MSSEPNESQPFLRVSGTKIIKSASASDGGSEEEEIILRGAGLGGWMCMENFISGFPGCEFQIREALEEVIGKEKSEYFFDRFLEHFFTLPDAQFFKSLGLNCIRIAINYRHFESDSFPRTLISGSPSSNRGFQHLDRVISLCASQGIYTIIDMHTAPGGQNGGWHCDAGTHIANFWIHRDFQDRLVWLWCELAKRYRDNPWIAGYNLLNEPADPKHTRLVALYDRLIPAIRDIDDRHILFLDGNTYATDFTHFPDGVRERWGGNVAYAIHDYSVYGFPSAPEPYERTEAQLERQRNTYVRKRRWMDERGLCVWNGEWGPVYARAEYDGEGADEMNKRRYDVLKDQLETYGKDRLSWSIWLYKDIGFQGMVHVSPDTPYIRLLKPFLLKKHRLAVDAWGASDVAVKHIFDPLVDLIKSSASDPAHLKLYPPIWGVEGRTTRLARTMLVAEFMVREWAEHFRGMGESELDGLARSFLFENCVQREGLNRVLRDSAVADQIKM